MNLSSLHNVYLIGIGGIGMSALARYFVANGKQVGGYDKTASSITDSLVELGVSIHFEDNVEKIEAAYLNKVQTLVIYTPAIPGEHSELNYFINNGYEVLKRSAVLGEITKQTTCLAVAGTHGKTTTTSILGHLLKECNAPVTAFLGGISENYNSNLILNGTEVTVVEADEYDRSFLTLSPDLACITSMDADHLDIYGDVTELIKSFKDFSKCLKPGGKLFVKNGLPLQGITYGLEDESNYSAQQIRIENGSYVFNLNTPKELYKNLKFNLPGRHNLLNAIVAMAMAIEYGCAPQNLAKAIASYKGVKRRFTYHIKTDNLIVIEDFAHHPQAIDALYDSVKELYADRKILAIFQPHLYSRTQDFANEFAESLSKFDELLLLDIYPARELPIEGVTSKWLFDKINSSNKQLLEKSQLINEIKKSDAEVVLILGAGDIGAEVKPIIEALKNEN